MKKNLMNNFNKGIFKRVLSSPRITPITNITTLNTGMRIASQSLHGETATVGVWIDTGSRYENKANNGVAHFLEHISFKGSSKRTQHDLEKEIENMGAHLNAYTSREQTVYFARVFQNDVPHAMEILSDILTNSLMTEQAIERERDVILREMIEVNKVYEELILDNLHEIAFPTSGLGFTILGPEKNIKKISKQDIKDYVKTHYTADRFVIAGAGAVNHQQLVDLSQEYFGKLLSPLNGADIGGADRLMTKGEFFGGERRIKYNTMKECHIALAFEGVSWTSELALPLMVLQTILGTWDRSSGNTNSQLAQDLASTESAESFMTFNTNYKDTGLFGIYFVAPPSTLPQAIQIILHNFHRCCTNITAEEVERAKNQMKINLLLQVDNYSNICEDIGRQMLTHGKWIPSAEFVKKIDLITPEDIRLVSHLLFNDKDHAMVGIGPVEKLPSYDYIRDQSSKVNLKK